MGSSKGPRRLLAAAGLLATIVGMGAQPLQGAEWAHWRGPSASGASTETGLVSGWSKEGQNLIWRKDFTGRSTPVVFAGRVCANGRAGEGIERQEVVACFDAGTGETLWERRFNVYHTTVPWNRVGWANVAGDPETGYLYVQGVGGLFFCLDSRNGDVVWSRNLLEELGFMEGYGGRTQTPFIDEDRLIVTFASNSWGSLGAPRHRLFAFDKKSGELLWISSPASSMADKNTQSTPAVAVINGRRLLIHGNGDGWIYALDAHTGAKVWGFHLSKRGINTSAVVDGTTVYATHSEENLDEPTMGRVVAIDATGQGDVTTTHERWRAPLGVGFSSPALGGGRLYVLDNSADLHALDAATGKEAWSLELGTVGKSSPVWADAKLYVTEVNGRFLIVEPGAESGKILDLEELSVPSGRYAEIYGSPAVAYGRLYFTTEEGIYCLGDAERPYRPEPSTSATSPGASSAEPAGPVAQVLAVPAEVFVRPGETVTLRLEAFDAKGHPLGTRTPQWSLEGLTGVLEAASFTPAPGIWSQVGVVKARLGELTASARVRVVGKPPMNDDFDSYPTGSRPPYLMSGISHFEITEVEGGKALAKQPSRVQLHRHTTFFGSPLDTGYTLQVDVQGTRAGRRVPDIGIVANGYTLELLGASQKLQIRSWPSALRMAREVDQPWEMGAWYTLKLRVDVDGETAHVHGKVWPRGEEEPAQWTLTVDDPRAIETGSPGLTAYSPATVYYDNLRVMENPRWEASRGMPPTNP